MRPRPPEGDEDPEDAEVSEVESDFPLDDVFARESTQALGATATPDEPGEPGERGRALATLDVLRESGEIDHYRLLGELGRGGMGVVYAAQDTKLGRKVAIKVLLSRGHAGLQRRLMREAMALAKLSHPNVVPIYEVREREDVTFLVMEYVEGVTLRAWLDSERSFDAILSSFASAAQGLIAAHEKGLIHRDFKPDNVMIGVDGRVRVMDFGLARASEDDDESGGSGAADLADAGTLVELEAFTRTGALLGTPAYMSPEQLRGEPAGAASDQFSFCIALFEAVYGQRPFAARSLDELSAAVESGVLVEVDADSEVPAWLHAILVRGLASSPVDRFASMRELVEALEAGEPTSEGLLAKFWDRKIPHFLGAYAAGGAAGIEIFNQISARFGVRAAVGDALLVGAATLVPSIVAVLWMQGEVGRKAWGRGMKLLVSANVVTALALALPFAGGSEATPGSDEALAVRVEADGDEASDPATAEPDANEATATDELPALVEVEARQPCVLMFPLSGELAEADQGLRTGVLTVVAEALSETSLAPLERGWLGEAQGRLEELHVPEGQAVPHSLMLDRMAKQGCDQMLYGALTPAEGGIALSLTLEREGEELQLAAFEAPLLELVDQASAWLVEVLEPGAKPDYKRVRDGFTSDEAALRIYIQAMDPFVDDPRRQLQLLDQAVELDSSFALASFFAGSRSNGLLANDETLRRYRRALDHRYRFTELRRIRVEAEYFSFTGSPEQAEGVLLAALERDPGNIEVLELLARLRIGRRNREAAIVVYERILAIEPDNVNALESLCTVYMGLWRFEEVVRPARKLVELRPEDAKGYLWLGQGLVAEGEVEEARTAIREAYRLDPSSSGSRTALANIEITQGDPREGMKLHREALDELRLRAEDNAQARTEYHKLLDTHLSYLLRFGRAAEAVELARPEIELVLEDSARSDQDIFMELETLLAVYGAAGEAEAAYAILDRIDPGPAPSARYRWLSVRLVVAFLGRDLDEAERLAARYEALADEAPSLRETIETDIGPLLLVAREQWAAAIEHYESLAERDKVSLLDEAIIWAFDGLDRFDDLDAKIAPLLVVNKNSPQLLYYQARIHRSRGEHEAARQALAHALELYAEADPDFEFHVRVKRLAAEYE